MTGREYRMTNHEYRTSRPGDTGRSPRFITLARSRVHRSASVFVIRYSLFLLVSLAPASPASAQSFDLFPIRQRPVDYFGEATRNPLAEFDARLESGEVTLSYREGSPLGYLPSLLSALAIPVESQVLTFSAAARNAQLVSAERPRALYFNDEIYVGYVPGSPEIELATFDEEKGIVFFTLRQLAQDKPRLDRDENCTQCHVHQRNTRGVPGLVLGTMLVEPPAKRSELVPLLLATPWSERFGTWYLTGEFGGNGHRGNGLGEPVTKPAERFSSEELAKRVDLGRYPSPHSDGTALLLLAHQSNVQNEVTRLLYERAFRRPTEATELRLARELLFADEAAFQPGWKGSTRFADLYISTGKADADGRSLRELDLSTRLMKWAVSDQISSRAVQSLPDEVRERLMRRIESALKGDVDAIPINRSNAVRSATRDLLRERGF